MILMDPLREDTPAACNDMMNTSMLIPPWDPVRLSGGYTVHAVPAPSSTHAEPTMSRYPSTSNQVADLPTTTKHLLC